MQPTLSMLCLLVKAERYLKSYEATGNPNTLLQYQQMMKKYMAMANKGSSSRQHATPAPREAPPASLPAVVLKYLSDGAQRSLREIAYFCKRDVRIVQALLKKLTEQGRISVMAGETYQITLNRADALSRRTP